MADSQEVTIALLHMDESKFMFDALKGPAPTDEEVVPGPLMCGEIGVIENVTITSDAWRLDGGNLESAQAKLEALGISPSFLSGESVWSSARIGMRPGWFKIKVLFWDKAARKAFKDKKRRRQRTGRNRK